MSLLAIELNDVDLQSGDGSAARSHGPGIALLDPEGLLLGEAARAQARLRPRRVVDRYWADLSMQTLPHPTAYAATFADLAYAQLESVWEERPAETDGVLLVVPGSFPREALGLILGMAQELSMPVRGLVDAAIASTVASAPGADLFHLDFFQHEALLTRLEQGHRLSRGTQLQIPEAGVSRLRAAWVSAAAEAFVSQTRFDPLHDAASEQQLYDGLHAWLAALETGEEVQMSVNFRGDDMTASLAREAVLRQATPAWRAVLGGLDELRGEGRPAVVNVAARGGHLTGLLDTLGSVGRATVTCLEAGAPLRGVLERSGSVLSPDGEVRYITQLPALSVADFEVAAPAPAPELEADLPTHLLLEAHAYPVGEAGVIVGTRPPADRPGIRVTGQTSGISRQHCLVRRENGVLIVEDQSRYGTFVNGERVEARLPLRIGDHLRIGSPGRELLAIALRDTGDDHAS
jgi:hypothetical protein